MHLPIAVFTVETYLLSCEEAAEALAEIGYDGVEWRVTSLPGEIPENRNYWNGNVCTVAIEDVGVELPKARLLADRLGLAMPSLGTYLSPDNLPQVEACLAAARAVGVPMLRVGLPGFDHSRPYLDSFNTAVGLWQPVVELGRRYGVRILGELHHGALCSSPSALVRFLSHWSPTEVGAIYDPGNMIHEGWEHPDIAIGVLGPYLAHVHVKNARWLATGEAAGRTTWRGEMCRLREGQVDWAQVLRSLRQAGYSGWLATEDFGVGDTHEKLRDNLAYLREVLAAID